MPVSSGIRLRPGLGFQRPLSAQRRRIGDLTRLLPNALLAPLVLLAFLTAGMAVYWTGSIHNADTVATVEAASAETPSTTGSVSKAN